MADDAKPPEDGKLLEDQNKNIIEVWKSVIGVQQHFNDIAMRIRSMFVTILLALFAAIGFMLDKKFSIHVAGTTIQYVVLLPLFGIACTYLFYFIDRYWYRRARSLPSAHGRNRPQGPHDAAGAHADWTPDKLQAKAAEIRPQTAALIEIVVREKAHPEQGMRAAIGILGHNRRKTKGVGRIAARLIESLVAKPPLTMRKLIDGTRRYRWFGSDHAALA
jgi:hypothetical protein